MTRIAKTLAVVLILVAVGCAWLWTSDYSVGAQWCTSTNTGIYCSDIGTLNSIHSLFHSALLMLRGLPRLYALNRTLTSWNRFSSTMSSASKIVLPVEEIENLWFGGLDLGPGKPVAMDCAKRWFMGGEEFDTTCKYHPPYFRHQNLIFQEISTCN